MTPFCLLRFALCLLPFAAFAAPCSKPVARNPAGNYILPGVLGGVVYRGDLALDAYAPTGEPRPAAVLIHGTRGNRLTYMTQLFELLAHAGYAWFAVDYHSAADVTEAVRYVQCPGRFNLSRELVLIGEDTGAQVALTVDSQFPGARVVGFGAKLDQEESKIQNPQSEILLVHGGADRESPPEPVEAACKKWKNCEFYPVAGAIHNFENWHPDQWHWKERLVAWLRADRRGLWKDIAYWRTGGLELLMDAYVPEGGGPFPAVIIAHGGGWEAGDKLTYVAPVFEPLARAGFAWFSINYRLTPYVRNPEQLEDLRAAIRYVRQNAARFHVDAKRIAILGESASGQLVAEVASEPCEGCEVQAVVSFYGVYNFVPWTADPSRRQQLGRLFGEWTEETLRRSSPLYHAHAGMPPVLIIQGTNERLYQPALEYAARLKEVGARHEVLLLEGAPHGMENWENHPEWVHYKQKLVDWLRAVLH